MDDMEREALRRAEQMRSAFPGNVNLHKNENEEISVPFEEDNTLKNNEEKVNTNPPKSHSEKAVRNDTAENNRFQGRNSNHKSPISFPAFARPLHSQRKKGVSEKGDGDIFDFLLKDKDTTLILLLIFFLYEDNSDPMLLMALVYLLV